MEYIIGSARIGENGHATGGKDGDQKQTGTDDYKGEVSLQKFYAHSKGWYILRPLSGKMAEKIAEGMAVACNNVNIGYNQNERLDVVKEGVWSKNKINADCSSLVRACCIYAGFDPGNFTTANEVKVLTASGMFADKIAFISLEKTPIQPGDILVTKTKGHTVVCVHGKPRSEESAEEYYPIYTGASSSIVSVLKDIGEADTSFNKRKDIALNNGFTYYSGTANENLWMVGLAKCGKLRRA